MKAQKSWGPWQLNLNYRVQDLWPQGDSSPAAFSALPSVRRPSPRLLVQKCHWSRSSGHFAFDSGSHSALLLSQTISSFKAGGQPLWPLQVPSTHILPCLKAPGKLIPFTSFGSISAHPAGIWIFSSSWGLLPCLWIKNGFQEMNPAAAISQQPARLMVMLVPSWGLFLWGFPVASLSFSCPFWLQWQPRVNNVPCVHRLVKHF